MTNGCHIVYVISGGIGLVGGLVGTGMTSDPLEKAAFTVFQSIGIASVGYGAYQWQNGDEKRLLIESLNDTLQMSDEQKIAFIKNYYKEQKKFEKREKFIKAMTYGLIAVVNIYNASLQQQGGIQSTLYFVGGANLLACISYSF